MIVHDLDVLDIASGPSKADAELIVHPQAPLARAIALQLLEPVGWRCAHVFDASRQVEVLQLAQRRALDVGEARHPAQAKERCGVGTLRRLALAARRAASSGSCDRDPKASKKDPALAAAGAVLFLEKVSPALEQLESSSGAIGTAVNHAIETGTRTIAEAPVDAETRDRWQERLWEAHQNDKVPYIERLAAYWGELCASRDRASAWANRLFGAVEAVWNPKRKPGGTSTGRSPV